ncbi:MAG: hydroxymethylbilane synthase [Armatimonadetes bacterium]|nr:hydroxymethylbilane synthase [Armatimonadota bacterium]
MQRRLRIGTRGSALARTQTGWVVARMRAHHPGLEVDTQIIQTMADRVQDVPLGQFRERGVFVKEIETALLAGGIDLAVHSMKDLPGDEPAGLVVGAVPEREDPRDALVIRDSARDPGAPSLPLRRGATVGCSSLRRKAQLLHRRPDLHVVDLRGNVDTRLRKLDAGQMDAIVLAAAGLARLGLSARVTLLLPEELCLPAVCQGALAVQCREEDAETRALLAPLEDAETRACVTAERAVLAALGGGCAVPIGALARRQGDTLAVRGVVARPDGTALVRRTHAGPAADPERVGRELGDLLLSAGGREMLSQMPAGER